MKLYRLGKHTRITDLSGQGGLYFAGRWHRKGTPILYTAEHFSLAKLEILANSELLPVDYYALTLEVPDFITYETVEAATLPPNWRDLPYPVELATVAEYWLHEKQNWLLRVPSAHSPTEYNFLLNPLHPDHQLLRVVSLEPHPFDTRLKPPAATAAPAPPGSGPPPAQQL